VVSFPQVSHQNPVYTSPLSHTCYVSRPSHCSLFDHPNNIGWGVQIIKLLIMNFSPFPCYIALLGPNTLLNTLFSNTFGLHSSINMSDQVSHRYKTTGKIIFLQTLIFVLFYSNLTVHTQNT
jgi:hypothetical protein